MEVNSSKTNAFLKNIISQGAQNISICLYGTLLRKCSKPYVKKRPSVTSALQEFTEHIPSLVFLSEGKCPITFNTRRLIFDTMCSFLTQKFLLILQKFIPGHIILVPFISETLSKSSTKLDNYI